MEHSAMHIPSHQDCLQWFVSAAVLVIVLYAVWTYIWSGQVSSPGKAVLITGCDTGFGNLLAKRLLTLKYRVFALCLDDQSEGAKDLTSKGCNVIKCDVTSDNDVTKAQHHVNVCLDKSGDVLWAVVNNAGIAEISFLECLPLSSYQRVMDVNVLGMVRILHAFLPNVRRSSGRVVNVASMAGRFALPMFSSYCMSKYAVVALSECLRMEVKQFGVHVSVIQPVYYQTPIVDMDTLTDVARRHWSKLAEDTRRDYGEKYFEDQFRVKKARSAMQTRTNLNEVVDSMTHAITARHPRRAYECHWTSTLMLLAMKYAPSFALEFVVMALGLTGKAATAK